MDLEQYLIKQREDATDKIVASLVNSKENTIKKSLDSIRKMLKLINGESYDEALKNIALDVVADCYNCEDPFEEFDLNESIFEQLNAYEEQLLPCCSAYIFRMDYFDKSQHKKYSRTIQVPGFLPVSEFCYFIIALFGFELGPSFHIETNFETLSPLDMLDEPQLIELFEFNDSCDFITEGESQNTVSVKLVKNDFLNRGANLEDLKLLKSVGGLVPFKDEDTLSDEQLIEIFSVDSYINPLFVKMYYEMPETFFDFKNGKISIGEAIKKVYEFAAEEDTTQTQHFLA